MTHFYTIFSKQAILLGSDQALLRPWSETMATHIMMVKNNNKKKNLSTRMVLFDPKRNVSMRGRNVIGAPVAKINKETGWSMPLCVHGGCSVCAKLPRLSCSSLFSCSSEFQLVLPSSLKPPIRICYHMWETKKPTLYLKSLSVVFGALTLRIDSATASW